MEWDKFYHGNHSRNCHVLYMPAYDDRYNRSKISFAGGWHVASYRFGGPVESRCPFGVAQETRMDAIAAYFA